MIQTVETTRYVIKENANLVVPKMIIANRMKNVMKSPVFLLVKMEQFVLQKLTAILMMKFVFLLVNLIRIVLVATNAPMAIVLNLAQMTITVLTMNNIVTSTASQHLALYDIK